MSVTPRFFRLVRHDNQNFAPHRLDQPQAEKFRAALENHTNRHAHRVFDDSTKYRLQVGPPRR